MPKLDVYSECNAIRQDIDADLRFLERVRQSLDLTESLKERTKSAISESLLLLRSARTSERCQTPLRAPRVDRASRVLKNSPKHREETSKASTAIAETSLFVITTTNPSTFAVKGSLIVLECADDGAAIGMARKIAEKTGREVTVRNADSDEIATIARPTTH